MGLILADMIGTELIWRFPEVAREPLDGADVLAYCFWREVTSLEFLPA